ncbi:hypothetical protein FRC00_011568 [Tulasnella sp. 408]|nr:hypothetical protein FRC00_011568 [Tulasnella sp. 408]
MPGHNGNARYGKKGDAQPRGGGIKKRDINDLQLRQPLPEKGPAERKRQRDQKQEKINSRDKRPRLTAQAKSQRSGVPGKSHSEKTPSAPVGNVPVPAIVQSRDADRSPEVTPFGQDVDTSPQGHHGQYAIAGPSATPQPLAGISTVVAAPNALLNEINFGSLHSVEDTDVAFPLRMAYEGSPYKIFRVGRDDDCEIRVSGLGVGK